MKKKELKNLAKKIAKAEILLTKKNISLKEKQELEKQIMQLSGKIKHIEEMVLLDDLIQEYIDKS